MSAQRLRIVICGLTISSSWGNGHATTYRALVRELTALGHDVLFLERDRPWYAGNRDLPEPPYGRFALYESLNELRERFGREVRDADAVIVGSYVPDGVEVGRWLLDTARGVRAFYDIDTPVTLAKLDRGDEEYVSRAQIPFYDLYLSFTGGPALRMIESRYGSPAARPLYCSVDPTLYYPDPPGTDKDPGWDLGYLGTYSPDRQPTLDRLLVGAANRWRRGRFVVAGPQYPKTIEWPANVQRIEHLPPSGHRDFYNRQRFTLNVTRADMIRMGYSPSVRLFEAAACGTPVISDYWDGLDAFFRIGEDILVAQSTREMLELLRDTSEARRLDIGRRARERVLKRHTARHRALELTSFLRERLEVLPERPTPIRSKTCRPVKSNASANRYVS